MKTGLKKTDFRAVCLKLRIGDKEVDSMIDTGASGHNVIPQSMAEELGLEPVYTGNTVTTISDTEVEVSRKMKLRFQINGYEQEQEFVVVKADLDFAILGMPFVETLTSVNFKNKTVYSGRARFPFTASRNDIGQLSKRQKAALIIYALNEVSYQAPVPIFDINNEKKMGISGDADLIRLQETLSDKIAHIPNPVHANAIYDEFWDNIDAFSKNKTDIGTFKGPIVGTIKLKENATPIFQPLRPQPYGYRDVLREHERRMLEIGVVQEEETCWRFNQVLAKKKDFGQKGLSKADLLRPCTDFRLLNELTVNDPVPIPNMQEIIDSMAGKKFFSQFDLTSAYWAILMDEQSRKYTAFVSQDGESLVYNRLSFGLKNAPSIFTRAMAWTLD